MNYSYLTLRGIGMTRLNFTLDGVPLNDPAENALYFNNFTDFGGAVDSVQIQRGVGTSTVGSPSYGGSINFTSMPLAENREVAAQLTSGSFGTQRGAIEFQSGQLSDGLAFYGRATYNQTDGFRDHSGVEQHSFYFNASYRTDDSILKLVALSGREQTQLSFYATDEATLQEDIRFNPLDPAETDDFGQDVVQLQYTKALGSSSSVTATAYYNGAQGWFQLWNDETTKDFLQKFWIDQQTLGLMATLNQERGPLTLNYGVHVNDFSGDHFMTVDGDSQYFNTGYKNEENAFVKAGYDAGRWHLYGDAQFRHAKFRYEGDVNLGSVDWSFFNPKVGARYRMAPGLSVYGSVGRASREPTRVDLLSGEDNATVFHDLNAVKPERVLDYELGMDWSTPRAAVALNLYAMEFHDEIALTGELSDIGLPLRRNVDQSYRRGIELDLKYKLTDRVGLAGNATFSHNRIRDWTQYVDVYGDDSSYLGSEPLAYHNVTPLLTPDVTSNLTVSWTARPWLGLEATGRYVGESYLDNTQSDRFTTPSFANLDLKASVGLERFWAAGRPRLNIFFNNVFNNDRIYASGYSYLYLTRGSGGTESLDGVSYFYPSATRNVMVTLDVKM